MRRPGIVGKLFLLTAGVFTLFILTEVLFLNFFFNEFYLYRKEESIKTSLGEFVRDYSAQSWSFIEAVDEVDRFSEQNGTPLVITTDEGIPLYGSSQGMYSMMTLEGPNGEYYQVYLDYLKDQPLFQGFAPMIGDSLRVKAIRYDVGQQYLEPYYIISGDQNYGDEKILEDYRDPATGKFDEGVNLIDIDATVVYVQEKPEISNVSNIDPELYKHDLLLRHVREWLDDPARQDKVSQVLGEGGVAKEEFTDMGVNYMFFIERLPTPGSGGYAFSLVSLQPIGEAMGVIREYYVYYLILAGFFIMLLSFIYSRMIARPLIIMNEAAKRMAGLDFTAVSRIKRQDEIGSLSDSLNSLARNLDSSMSELTRLNQQLQNDIDHERRQEEKRREFVANISHELKTPLGIIKSYAEGIKDNINTEKRAHYLDVVIDEVEKMDMLVMEMLDLSRLESASIKLDPCEFDLGAMITRYRQKFQQTLADNQLDFVFNEESCMVWADPRRIDQVIGNLIGNAVRYSDPGATIRVRIVRMDVAVITSVENSGVHIDEDELPRIWERFYRVEKSRTRSRGGTGLGLLIVKNILELHKSDFGVRNTTEGVEFYFSLPYAR